MNNTVEQLLSRYRAHELSKVIDYDKFSQYAITYHSTRIEGSTLTEMETQVLLDHDLTPKGKPLEHSLMVKDHFQALLFVLKQAAQKTAISVNLIQQINALVMKNTGNVYHTALGTVDVSILTLKKIYKTHRHPPWTRSGIFCSDSARRKKISARLPPESPSSKSQTGNFMDTVHSLKEGDSGSFAPPGAGRYAMQMSGMTAK